jgi:hypothetical protein
MRIAFGITEWCYSDSRGLDSYASIPHDFEYPFQTPSKAYSRGINAHSCVFPIFHPRTIPTFFGPFGLKRINVEQEVLIEN